MRPTKRIPCIGAFRSAAALVFGVAAFSGFAASGESEPEPIAESASTSDTPHLEILFPLDGTIVADPVCGLFVAGVARIPRVALDVIIAIDTSRSTIESSGADIDADGVLGRPDLEKQWTGYPVPSTDPGDSILAAEVEAARRILAGLDFSVDRVGVVAFSGGSRSLAFWRRDEAARTVIALTNDENQIRETLDEIGISEPLGGTNLAAAIDQVVAALGDRRRTTDPPPRAHVYFFTDGQPTLPKGPERLADNVRSALQAIDRAASSGIRIDSFGIGREALDGPIVPVEMAVRTGGTFTPVRHPGDLADILSDPNHSSLDSVVVHNATTGRRAHHMTARPEGTWAAFVDVADGDNRIEAVAAAASGVRAIRSAVVHNDVTREPTPIPESLLLQREELLEDCLRSATGKRLTLEAERLAEARERLVNEIEQERRKALQRSDEQRKRLELDVEVPNGDASRQ